MIGRNHENSHPSGRRRPSSQRPARPRPRSIRAVFQVHQVGELPGFPGDLILIAFQADFLAGPDNSASRLKVEIEGSGLSKKHIRRRTLPTPRTPKVPGEIQAYVPVEGPVTPS